MNPRLPVWSLAGAVLAAAWLSGCGSRNAGDSPPVERTTATATLSAVPQTSDLTGVWTVVGHYIPGISAMTDADAAAWHGQAVRLTAAEAISPGTHCDQPTYATRTVARDSLLGGFHLPPTSLAPLASLEHLVLLEVSCHGAPWAAMGGQLIKIDADHVLAPWDGVFFELERDHDFRPQDRSPSGASRS